MAQIMEFILNLLLLRGKFLTTTAAETFHEAIRKCLRFKRRISMEYNTVTQMIGPFENMLEFINYNSSQYTCEGENYVLTSEVHYELCEKFSKIKNDDEVVTVPEEVTHKRETNSFEELPLYMNQKIPDWFRNTGTNQRKEKPQGHDEDYLVDNLHAILKSQELLLKNIIKLVNILEKGEVVNSDNHKLQKLKKKMTACSDVLSNNKHQHKFSNIINNIIEDEITRCRFRHGECKTSAEISLKIPKPAGIGAALDCSHKKSKLQKTKKPPTQKASFEIKRPNVDQEPKLESNTKELRRSKSEPVVNVEKSLTTQRKVEPNCKDLEEYKKLTKVNEKQFNQFEDDLWHVSTAMKFMSLKDDYLNMCKCAFYNKRQFIAAEAAISKKLEHDEDIERYQKFMTISDSVLRMMEAKLLEEEVKNNESLIAALKREDPFQEPKEKISVTGLRREQSSEDLKNKQPKLKRESSEQSQTDNSVVRSGMENTLATTVSSTKQKEDGGEAKIKENKTVTVASGKENTKENVDKQVDSNIVQKENAKVIHSLSNLNKNVEGKEATLQQSAENKNNTSQDKILNLNSSTDKTIKEQETRGAPRTSEIKSIVNLSEQVQKPSVKHVEENSKQNIEKSPSLKSVVSNEPIVPESKTNRKDINETIDDIVDYYSKTRDIKKLDVAKPADTTVEVKILKQSEETKKKEVNADTKRNESNMRNITPNLSEKKDQKIILENVSENKDQERMSTKAAFKELKRDEPITRNKTEHLSEKTDQERILKQENEKLLQKGVSGELKSVEKNGQDREIKKELSIDKPSMKTLTPNVSEIKDQEKVLKKDVTPQLNNNEITKKNITGDVSEKKEQETTVQKDLSPKLKNEEVIRKKMMEIFLDKKDQEKVMKKDASAELKNNENIKKKLMENVSEKKTQEIVVKKDLAAKLKNDEVITKKMPEIILEKKDQEKVPKKDASTELKNNENIKKKVMENVFEKKDQETIVKKDLAAKLKNEEVITKKMPEIILEKKDQGRVLKKDISTELKQNESTKKNIPENVSDKKDKENVATKDLSVKLKNEEALTKNATANVNEKKDQEGFVKEDVHVILKNGQTSTKKKSENVLEKKDEERTTKKTFCAESKKLETTIKNTVIKSSPRKVPAIDLSKPKRNEFKEKTYINIADNNLNKEKTNDLSLKQSTKNQESKMKNKVKSADVIKSKDTAEVIKKRYEKPQQQSPRSGKKNPEWFISPTVKLQDKTRMGQKSNLVKKMENVETSIEKKESNVKSTTNSKEHIQNEINKQQDKKTELIKNKSSTAEADNTTDELSKPADFIRYGKGTTTNKAKIEDISPNRKNVEPTYGITPRLPNTKKEEIEDKCHEGVNCKLITTPNMNGKILTLATQSPKRKIKQAQCVSTTDLKTDAELINVNKKAFEDLERTICTVRMLTTSTENVSKSVKSTTETKKRKIDDPVKKSMSTRHLAAILKQKSQTIRAAEEKSSRLTINKDKKTTTKEKSKTFLRKSSTAAAQKMKSLTIPKLEDQQVESLSNYAEIGDVSDVKEKSNAQMRRTTKNAMKRQVLTILPKTSGDKNQIKLKKFPKVKQQSIKVSASGSAVTVSKNKRKYIKTVVPQNVVARALDKTSSEKIRRTCWEEEDKKRIAHILKD